MRKLGLALVLGAICAAALGAGRADASTYALYGIQDDAWIRYGNGSVDRARDAAQVDGRRRSCASRCAGTRSRRRARERPQPGDPRTAGGVRGDSGRCTRRSPCRRDDLRRAALDERRPRAELGADERLDDRELRLRRAAPLPVDPRLDDLERAEQADLPAPDEPGRLHGATPEPGLRRAAQREPLGAGRRRRDRAARRGGGVSPITWIRAMAAAHARLDAYAHHPYPAARARRRTPAAAAAARRSRWRRSTSSSARWSARSANKRIWLTEYAYQMSPPDRRDGVSTALQAQLPRRRGAAGLPGAASRHADPLPLPRRAQISPRWQSGLMRVNGSARPACRAFQLPLSQASRRGLRTVLWGQVRPSTREAPVPARAVPRAGTGTGSARPATRAPAASSDCGARRQRLEAAHLREPRAPLLADPRPSADPRGAGAAAGAAPARWRVLGGPCGGLDAPVPHVEPLAEPADGRAQRLEAVDRLALRREPRAVLCGARVSEGVGVAVAGDLLAHVRIHRTLPVSRWRTCPQDATDAPFSSRYTSAPWPASGSSWR